MNWTKLAEDSIVERTANNLKKRGIETFIVNTGDEAKKKVLEFIPEGSEVMNNTSATLDQIGVSKEITESGKYIALRKKVMSMNDKEQRHAWRKMTASAEYSIGSVNAVTEDGQVVIVSNTGSQLSPYASSAANVIWVVGTQKIVRNLDEAFKRIKEHTLPLESERLKKIYGVESNISKILIIEKEVAPNRIKLILVKEKLGF